MKITVCRKEHFNAAHRLHNPDWSKEKNEAFYGKCNNEYYHGHNYELIVKVTKEIDPESGYALDMKQLSDIIKTHITDKFDHKNLNLQTEEFRKTIPSAENMAVVFHQILTRELGNDCKIKIVLYETERNFVEFPSE
ncbi:MAG: 6-carboxytetrahydropterin synthase [Cytophagales bacterium]|nr:MAG: 6-carboxytetrahydropterin synthase [Cytophagales bacterium]